MPFDTVLIPTDGSDAANTAAHRGFELADALGASVHVLSVADSSIATGAGYAGDSPSIRKRLRETATARANSLRDEALEWGFDATAAVREGIPAAEIVDYADEHGIDAIVIGTAGRGGVSRAVVGSVADKVLRTASVPVVTIRPTAVPSIEGVDSILLPTDGSETATAVVHLGFELAEALFATVHLLSVVDTDRTTQLISLLDDDDTSERSLEEATESLETLATDGRERTLDIRTTARTGSPAETIVEYAQSERVDLIALGTAGRGGFERLLVGSVTDEVVRTAPVPVLTTRLGSADGENQNRNHT